MALSAPAVRKHLSADALLGLLRTGFAAIVDHRPGKLDIGLSDALTSAFALLSLTSPSLLAFDRCCDGKIRPDETTEAQSCDE